LQKIADFRHTIPGEIVRLYPKVGLGSIMAIPAAGDFQKNEKMTKSKSNLNCIIFHSNNCYNF